MMAMGRYILSLLYSPPPPALAPAPELDPWREVTWSDAEKEQMLQKLKDFKLAVPNISQLRILLHGPVGAGKSSFINSVDSVLRGYNTSGALTNSIEGTSFTTKLKIHRLKKDVPGSFYPFVFADVMGLQSEELSGVHPDDIVKILLGHVNDGYIVNPIHPISTEDSHYKRNPEFTDRIHCLVSVFPAENISFISEEIFVKMKTVRKRASDLGIPQIVIMTMVDKVCPLVKKDLKKIYTSRKIKDKMQECSNRLGVSMNCIFPVQNYHEQITNNVNVDILLLMALTNIINFANDYVEDQSCTE